MKTRNAVKILSLIFAVAVAANFIGACTADAEEVTLSSFFGAPVTVTFSAVHSVRQRDELIKKINAVIEMTERSLSTENEDSVVYKFNASTVGRVVTDAIFNEVFALSKSYYDMTEGAFDPAIYPLSDLWGFTKRFSDGYRPSTPYDRQKDQGGGYPLPDPQYISAFRYLADFSSMRLITVDGVTEAYSELASVTVGDRDYQMKLDFSGVAKGYAADKVKKIIDEAGVSGVYVSFGGSSLYLTDKAGDDWWLGIVKPEKTTYRGTFAKIHVRDKFVATSGTYENAYATDGETYHHIIDGATGAPAKTDLVSVTLIGDSGAETDALATALVIFGKQKALDFLKDGKFGFVLVDEDKNVFTSERSLTLLSDGYTVNYV
ncbi:MAG: FAD:protein FMN transferase [Clostridia bacterium]|nr:FAD:protein FMN transferase [Clostridia bacterium]